MTSNSPEFEDRSYEDQYAGNGTLSTTTPAAQGIV